MPPPHTLPPIEASALARLAIFPLSGAVLYPGNLLPLHIFEPRYRQLVQDALAGQTPIAIVAPVTSEADKTVAPLSIRPVAGVGQIIHHEPLPDGRYHILLMGQGRIWIDEELASPHPYREVRAHWYPDVVDDDIDIQQRMQTLQQVIFRLHTGDDELASSLAAMLERDIAPGVIADTFANVLVPEPAIRQTLLEERSAKRRLDYVIQHIAGKLMPDDPGTPWVH